MGLWKPDADEAMYITDLRDPIIHKEYVERKRQLGLAWCEELNGQQRRDFDRDMVAKYGEQYPPPGRTPWLFRIWAMLEENGQI